MSCVPHESLVDTAYGPSCLELERLITPKYGSADVAPSMSQQLSVAASTPCLQNRENADTAEMGATVRDFN